MEILDVKKNAYVLLAAIFAIVLTACGTETDEEEKPQTGSSNAEFDALITAMEEETEGTATLLFENNESQSHEREGLSLTLDAYPLVELEDFYTNFSIPFGDQTDGGVILAQYTIKNDSDQDLHYMPTLNIDYVGATKHHNNYRDLIPLEEQLPTILAPDNEYLVEAEDKVTGYYAYPFGQDEPEEILAEGNVIVDTPAPTTEYNADEAPRYTDPDNVAIATIRFEIDNQSEEEIGLGDISSKLTVNDGSQYLLNEGMLLPYDNSDTVAPGEEGELLQTFLLDKEMYEKIWKDKSMEIEAGPMRNTEAKDISKGNKATFLLK